MNEYSIPEADRQAIVLALARLSTSRPGWNEYLRTIADRFSAAEMFDDFRKGSEVMQVWIVLKDAPETDEFHGLEIQGCFTEEAMAVAACRTENHVMGEFTLNEELPDERPPLKQCRNLAGKDHHWPKGNKGEQDSGAE